MTPSVTGSHPGVATWESCEAVRRVSNGIGYLDGIQPGWHRRINLARFDLGDCCKCVLGQLYGVYGEALDLLRGCRPTRMGFNALGSETPKDFELLEETWIAAIRRLQAPVELPTVRSQQPTPEYAIAK